MAPVSLVIAWVVVEVLSANGVTVPNEINLALQAAITTGLVFFVPNKDA